jgi:hypothetical protein
VFAGAILALWHMRAIDGVAGPPRFVGIAHGVAGLAGLIVLLVASTGPPRAVANGAGSFGTEAAVLLAGALATGVWVYLARRKAIPIVIHAGLAITGFVLLLAWTALG